MADRNVDVKFRFLTDKAASNQLMREQDRVEQGYDDMARAARRTSDAGREALGAQIRLARENASIYGDVSSRTAAFSGLLSGLGGGVAGSRLMIASDILDATEAAKSMRAELPKMTAQLAEAAGGVSNLALAGGAAALAVAGLYAAVQILGKSSEEAEAKTRAHIAALEYINNLTPGTTQQLEEERNQLQATIDKRQALIDQLQTERDQLNDNLSPAKQLGEALGIVGYGVDEYDAKLKELNQAQDEDKNKVTELNTAIKEGTAGVADRLKAEQDALADLEKNTAYEIELRRKVATYTVQQVDQELAALDREKTAKENQLAILEAAADDETKTAEARKLYAEQAAALKDEINGLTMDMADLNTLVRQAAEVREQEARKAEAAKNAIEALNNRLDETIQKEIDRGNALRQGAEILAKAEYDRQQVTMEGERAIAESESKYQDDRRSATRDFEQQRADIESKAAEARTAVLQEHQDTLAGIHQKYRDDTIRDERKFRRDQERDAQDHRDTLLEAAASLDAPAVLAEQKRFTKDQKRKGEDFRDSQRERKKEYRQQLKDENDAFRQRQEQAKANERRDLQRLQQQYNTRLQQLDSAHRTEIQRIRQANEDKLRAITDAANRELKQLFGFNTDEYQVRADHYRALLTQLKVWGAQAKAAVTGSSTPAKQERTLPGRYVPTEYDAGGYTYGQVLKSDPGEFMLTRQTTRALERGFGGALTQQRVQQLMTTHHRTTGPVTIYVSGAGDPEAVGRIVLDKLGQVLGAA